MTCKELNKVRSLICKHPLCVKTGNGGQRWRIVERVFRNQLATEEAVPYSQWRARNKMSGDTPATADALAGTETYNMVCHDHYSIALSERELRRLADKETVVSRDTKGNEVILSVITTIRDGSPKRGEFTPKAFDERLELLRKAADIKHNLKETLDMLENLIHHLCGNYLPNRGNNRQKARQTANQQETNV